MNTGVNDISPKCWSRQVLSVLPTPDNTDPAGNYRTSLATPFFSVIFFSSLSS